MPTKSQLKTTPKNAPKKPGSPGGIPKWGWIMGAAIGLLIGYMLIRSSSASGSPGSSTAGSGGNPATDTSAANQASGNIPWEQILQALGLRGGGASTQPGTSVDTSTSQTTAAAAAIDPGPQATTAPETVQAGVDPSPIAAIPAGAPGSPEYLAATTGMAITPSTPDTPALVGIDAKMAHAPSGVSPSVIAATQKAESYAHTAAVQAAGYTSGF